MNMGGVGRDSNAATELVKPVADIAQKAAKAGAIKKIKAKVSVKFDPKKVKTQE